MDLYRLTIQDSQDSMQFDLLDAPIKIEDVEGAVDNTVLTGDIFTDYLFLKKRWEQKWAIMCKDEYERLRGFYTRQWSLATVPSVKVTQGYLEDTSWEGQVFYINTPYGGEIDGLTKMTGDTYQQAYSGKNMIGFPVGTIEQNGLKLVFEADGTITINGTRSGTSATNYNESTLINFAVGDITITIIPISGTFSGANIGYRALTANSQPFYQVMNSSNNYSPTGGTHSFTQTEKETVERIQLLIGSGTAVFDNYKFKLQVTAGTSHDTDYEIFVGGVPSPNPQYPQAIRTVTGEQTITINGTNFKINLGKNLFDKNAVTTGVYINSSGVTSAGNNYAASDYIPVVPNAKYYYSGSTNLVGNAARLAWYKADKTFISASTYEFEGELTAPADAFFFRTSIRINAGGVQAPYLDTYQFEAGDKKTDYASYIAPIELNDLGNGYQDEIAFDGTEWKLRKKTTSYTFDGSADENWTRYTGGNLYWGFYITIPDVLVASPSFANIGKNAPDASPWTGGKNTYRISSTNNLVFALVERNDSLMSLAEWQSFLAGENMLVKLALTTPTETTITDATLISQLNAIQAALQEGQNTVAVTANGSNLPAKTITLNGIAGREKPVLAQTNVRIGLSDGGVLNACECRQNVTLSMRETA